MIDAIYDAIHFALEDPSQAAAFANLARSAENLDDSEVDALVIRLANLALGAEPSDIEPAEVAAGFGRLLQPLVLHLTQREMRLIEDGSGVGWSDERLGAIETIYGCTPATSDLRNHLLRWLATSDSEGPRELWGELICEDPPEHRLGIVLAFSPLMQSGFAPSDELLSKLLNRATQHSQIAPAVFDLFNYYFRNGRIETHPVEQRAEQLTDLLGQLTGQLGRVEEGDLPAGFDARELNQLVSDSVALIVSLCDAFALAEHKPAIAKLHQTMHLRHRRVQTEAAAALTRLGDELGQQALIELAEQPVARLRVLAYAEELGFKDEISLELQGEIALAESHLAIWLSEPDQMGLAPSSIELLDNRELYWPSYEHPIQCYLFQYSYGQGEKAHSNIGICGPLTHAFAADLRHLSKEEIYAAFAGWQTIHQEIFNMPLARAQQTFANQVRRLSDALAENEVEDTNIQIVGSFFGELVLVATGIYEGKPGTVIVDDHDSSWFGHGNPDAPIDWQMAYSIWRGKQLLAKFNPTETISF